MAGTLNPLRVFHENGSGALTAPGYVEGVALSANTAKSLAVPAGATFVVFSATGNFYANYSTTAAVATDTTDGTASELNPTVRYISGVTAISLIAPADTKITASFFKS